MTAQFFQGLSAKASSLLLTSQRISRFILVILIFFLIAKASDLQAAWLDPECGQENERACYVWDDDYWLIGGLGGCDRGLETSLEICGCLQYLYLVERCGCRVDSYWGCIIPKYCTYRTDTCLIPEPCNMCRNDDRHSSTPDFVQSTWGYKTLSEQARLTRNEPINWYTHIATHNAYNNYADGYFLTANQMYSISDQLDMGARVIMLDVHAITAILHDVGLSFDFLVSDDLRLSHADEIGGLPHAGASPQDRLFVLALIEIRNWLESHPGEVVILELEDILDGLSAAENHYTGMIEKYLGSLALRKSEKQDDRWPSVVEMLSLGRQVLVLSQEHQDSDILFNNEWGGEYKTGFSAAKVKNFDCTAFETARTTNPQLISEVYEDRSTAELASWVGWIKKPIDVLDDLTDLEVIEIDKLTRCGINIVGLDMLDSTRYDGLVWSWEEDFVALDGQAAKVNADSGRWRSASLEEELSFACARSGDPAINDHFSTQWRITQAKGPWHDGGELCRNEFGEEFKFSVPANGKQSYELGELVKNDVGADVWLAYRDKGNGNWRLDRAEPEPYAVTVRPNPSSEGLEVQLTATRRCRVNYNSLDCCEESIWSFGDGSQIQADCALEYKKINTPLGTIKVPFASNYQGSKTYANEGSYPIRLETGQIGPLTGNAVITNAPPEVYAGPDFSAYAGTQISYEGAFSDPGKLDTHTATIVWGDDTAEEPLLVTATQGDNSVAGTVNAEHTYFECGSHRIRLTVQDDGDASASDEAHINITEAPPSIECPAYRIVEQTSPEGAEVDLDDPDVSAGVCGEVTTFNNAPAIFAPGLTEVTWTARNTVGVEDVETGDMNYSEASCVQAVYVQDTTPPEIGQITATPDTIWPPDHRMVPVSVVVDVSDSVDPAPECSITSIDIFENTARPHDFSPDWEITSPLTVDLLAERFGKSGDRLYSLILSCQDSAGNKATGSTVVTVPHDMKKQHKKNWQKKYFSTKNLGAVLDN